MKSLVCIGNLGNQCINCQIRHSFSNMFVIITAIYVDLFLCSCGRCVCVSFTLIPVVYMIDMFLSVLLSTP